MSISNKLPMAIWLSPAYIRPGFKDSTTGESLPLITHGEPMAEQGKRAKAGKTAVPQPRRNFFATLDAELIKSIKRVALEDDTSASEILEEAARDWLERRKKAPKR